MPQGMKIKDYTGYTDFVGKSAKSNFLFGGLEDSKQAEFALMTLERL